MPITKGELEQDMEGKDELEKISEDVGEGSKGFTLNISYNFSE